jgi:DNA-binding transcriptional regulator YhcF (GntR family)
MSARPALIVDTGDPTPPYEQLRRQLADLIESAVLHAGDRLPPVRQLAADLGLAVGTVARTYRELESVGLVSSRRGGGTRVSATVPALSDAQRAQLVHTYAEAFVQRAALLGADPQLIQTAVARALRLEPAANPAVPR